jgi:medium-chain acyl-[acyl-carrier-protein] hydrolase
MDDFDRWVVRPRPRPEAALLLLCIPFAGAGTGVFHGWSELLPSTVELWLLRPPGRETRLRETPYRDLRRLAADCAAVVAPRVRTPLAVFGHSLGAAVALELAHQLGRHHQVPVAHLLVSGLPAPHLPRLPAIGHLPADEFLDALDGRYQQIPPALRADPEIREMYLPLLRADVVMYEAYRYTGEVRLTCPVTAFGATADAGCPPWTLHAWENYTSGPFGLTTLSGGHFNFNTPDERRRMVESISRALGKVCVG